MRECPSATSAAGLRFKIGQQSINNQHHALDEFSGLATVSIELHRYTSRAPPTTSRDCDRATSHRPLKYSWVRIVVVDSTANLVSVLNARAATPPQAGKVYKLFGNKKPVIANGAASTNA
jgi:DNA polymerase III epsilon subunit-like protein